MVMEEKARVYKCSVCGNIVEMMQLGAGELVCCGKPMELLEEKTQDEGNEKHVPVIERTETGVKVKVGSVAHPMEESHFIQWIEILADGEIQRKHLSPGQAPEAEFCTSAKEITAREYCNIHGHWKS